MKMVQIMDGFDFISRSSFLFSLFFSEVNGLA